VAQLGAVTVWWRMWPIASMLAWSAAYICASSGHSEYTLLLSICFLSNWWLYSFIPCLLKWVIFWKKVRNLIFPFHKVASVRYFSEVDIVSCMCKKFLPSYNGAKIIFFLNWSRFSGVMITYQSYETLSRISSRTRSSVQTVSDLCLKRICSLDTSAFSALGVFDDNRTI